MRTMTEFVRLVVLPALSRRLEEAPEEVEEVLAVDGAIGVDFGAVMERMRRLRADISHNDSVQRFTDLGIDVFLGTGRFTSPRSVEVDGQTLHFARAVIATGGRAAAPLPRMASATSSYDLRRAA